jgi:apolipoprotein N-acyltransferase
VLIPSDAGTLGPLICFESAFPDMSRRATDLGAQLLVFQTATSTFQGSWAQPQHASIAAVRAVETGRPALHAALTGTTAAFDAEGRRLGWVPASSAGVLLAPVQLTATRTPYDRAGDWMLALSAIVLGLALMIRAYRPVGDAPAQVPAPADPVPAEQSGRDARRPTPAPT